MFKFYSIITAVIAAVALHALEYSISDFQAMRNKLDQQRNTSNINTIITEANAMLAKMDAEKASLTAEQKVWYMRIFNRVNYYGNKAIAFKDLKNAFDAKAKELNANLEDWQELDALCLYHADNQFKDIHAYIKTKDKGYAPKFILAGYFAEKAGDKYSAAIYYGDAERYLSAVGMAADHLKDYRLAFKLAKGITSKECPPNVVSGVCNTVIKKCYTSGTVDKAEIIEFLSDVNVIYSTKLAKNKEAWGEIIQTIRQTIDAYNSSKK